VLNLLNEPLRSQAIGNVTDDKLFDVYEREIEKNEVDQWAMTIIRSGFTWSASPQGWDYWWKQMCGDSDFPEANFNLQHVNHAKVEKLWKSQQKETVAAAPVEKEEVKDLMENTLQIEHIQFGDSVELKKLQHGQVYNQWRFTEGMEVAARDYTVQFVDLHDNTIQINGCWIPVSFVATVSRDGKQIAAIEQPVAPAPTKVDINTINAGDTIILRYDLENCARYGMIMYSDTLMNMDKLTFRYSMFAGADGTFYCNENPYLYHIDMVKEVIPCDKLKIEEQPVQEVVTPSQTPLMHLSEQIRFETFVAAALQGLSTKDSSPIMIAVRAINIAEAVMSELSNKYK